MWQFTETYYAHWFQDSMPHLCAKFGELKLFFDQESSKTTYESEGGVNQESVKMFYSRYDWKMLGISYSSWSINHYKRSLVLNQTIMPNLQHAKVRDTSRLSSCPSDLFDELVSQMSTIISKDTKWWLQWWSGHGIDERWKDIGAEANMRITSSSLCVDISVWNQEKN